MKIFEEDGAGIGGVSSAGAMAGGGVAIPSYGSQQGTTSTSPKIKKIKVDKPSVLSLVDKYK